MTKQILITPDAATKVLEQHGITCWVYGFITGYAAGFATAVAILPISEIIQQSGSEDEPKNQTPAIHADDPAADASATDGAEQPGAERQRDGVEQVDRETIERRTRSFHVRLSPSGRGDGQLRSRGRVVHQEQVARSDRAGQVLRDSIRQEASDYLAGRPLRPGRHGGAGITKAQGTRPVLGVYTNCQFVGRRHRYDIKRY